ncbi:MAG: hypothetical protein J6112_00960, partial [Clostridia bacterium]|nr:hypothetical protein [Clostridia bacterium]
SENQKMKNTNLSKTKLYGRLSFLPRADIQTIIEWLIDQHYILKTKGLYPVLHPTYEGQHYSETITVGKIRNLAKTLESSQYNKQNTSNPEGST